MIDFQGLKKISKNLPLDTVLHALAQIWCVYTDSQFRVSLTSSTPFWSSLLRVIVLHQSLCILCHVWYLSAVFMCIGVVIVILQTGFTVSAAYTTYYLNGSNTAQVGLFSLPQCSLILGASGGSLQYLRLTNTHTSTIVAEREAYAIAPDESLRKLFWNTSSHNTLDPTYTGLYRCTADAGMSAQTHQLNVVGMYTMTVCIVSYNDETLDIGILSIVHLPKMMTSWQPLPFLA